MKLKLIILFIWVIMMGCQTERDTYETSDCVNCHAEYTCYDCHTVDTCGELCALDKEYVDGGLEIFIKYDPTRR